MVGGSQVGDISKKNEVVKFLVMFKEHLIALFNLHFSRAYCGLRPHREGIG